MAVTVRIQGAEQLIANLNRVGSQMRGRIGSDAIDAGGEIIETAAYRRCAIKGQGSLDGYYHPVDTWYPATDRAGAVKRSITRSTQGLTCIVGSNHMIAPKLEFGLPHHEPRPFMRMAIDENSDEAQRVIGEAIMSGVQGATI